MPVSVSTRLPVSSGARGGLRRRWGRDTCPPALLGGRPPEHGGRVVDHERLRNGTRRPARRLTPRDEGTARLRPNGPSPRGERRRGTTSQPSTPPHHIG